MVLSPPQGSVGLGQTSFFSEALVSHGRNTTLLIHGWFIGSSLKLMTRKGDLFCLICLGSCDLRRHAGKVWGFFSQSGFILFLHLACKEMGKSLYEGWGQIQTLLLGAWCDSGDGMWIQHLLFRGLCILKSELLYEMAIELASSVILQTRWLFINVLGQTLLWCSQQARLGLMSLNADSGGKKWWRAGALMSMPTLGSTDEHIQDLSLEG